jgi:hypothetical protein
MRANERIYFLQTDAGGRSGPVRSGYVALVGVEGLPVAPPSDSFPSISRNLAKRTRSS